MPSGIHSYAFGCRGNVMDVMMTLIVSLHTVYYVHACNTCCGFLLFLRLF